MLHMNYDLGLSVRAHSFQNVFEWFNPIWHWLFVNRQSWGEGHKIPHHNFVVIAAMIMKLDRGIKIDVFYTVVTKTLGTSLLLRNYDVMTYILAHAYA